MNSFVIKNHWYGSVRREELRTREGLPIPDTFLISPTMRCNLRCNNCYAANYDTKDDLELEVIDRVLTEGEDLGIFLATDNIKEKSLREVLNSPYFRGIRSRQPYGDNLLRPCMIIDQPHVLRDICDEFHPYPTHEGAETLVTTLCGDLDRYSKAAAEVLDPAWEHDFVSRGFTSPDLL